MPLLTLNHLYYSVGAPYRSNATWQMADSTAGHVRKMKDDDGQYLWQPMQTAWEEQFQKMREKGEEMRAADGSVPVWPTLCAG